MSRLLTANDYRREISALEQLIREQRAAGPVDFATEVSIRSLEQRHAELRRELEDLGDTGLPGHELEVVLIGAPVVHESVEVPFLAALLERLQKLITAIAGAASGSLARTGPIKKRIARRSRLRLAGTFSGSFGLRLEAVGEQLELEGMSVVAPAFDALLELLESGEDSDRLLQSLAPVGARATSEYRALLEHLRVGQAGVRVAWPGVLRTREASIRPGAAERIANRLNRVEQRQWAETKTGELHMGDRRDLKFGFTTDGGDVFRGTISPDLLEDVTEFFGKRCRAYIVITEAIDTLTKDVRRHYRLLELRSLDQSAADEPPTGA